MKEFWLIVSLFCLPLIGKTQDFADPEFYLVDSLDVGKMDVNERQLLDSLLHIYHDSAVDSVRVSVLNKITNRLSDDNIWPKYNLLSMREAFYRMFGDDLDDEEKRYYASIYASGIGNIGYYEDQKGNAPLALEYYFASLEIKEHFDLEKEYPTTYTNIGATYYRLNETEQAVHYLQKGYNTLHDESDLGLQALVINNLAVIYGELKNIDSSLYFNHLSLKIAEESENDFGIAMSCNNIAGLYDTYFAEDSVAVAKEYLDRSLTLFKESNSNRWISLTYEKLARHYMLLDDLVSAEKMANFAMYHAQKTLDVEAKMKSFKLLFETKKANGKTSEALGYYEKYVALNDSLVNDEIRTSAKMKALQQEFEIQKEIEQKEIEKRLAITEAQKSTQYNRMVFALVVLVVLALFVVVLYYRNKKISLQKDVIETQSEERKVLLKEIHHRVKNNFQIICSVLRLQAGEADNPIISKALEDAVNRIQSMAEVHELIYKQESFTHINPAEYFDILTRTLVHSQYTKEIDYQVDVKVEHLSVETMISLGISLNELITNSIKHAFNDQIEHPSISIHMNEKDEKFHLKYWDNGKGYASKMAEKSFGLELIQILIEQLQGEMKIYEEGGKVITEVSFMD